MQEQNKEKTEGNFAIALGANLNSTAGTAYETLRLSLKLFKNESLQIQKQSRWYSTPAFPPGSGPDYVNAVVLVRTHKTPQQVLAALNRIEQKMGRTRNKRWEPRLCDLDIVFNDGVILPDQATYEQWKNLPPARQTRETPDRLILPHPRLQDRAFVLVPLLDVAPDWRHPVIGLDVRQMLAALPADQIAEISPITP